MSNEHLKKYIGFFTRDFCLSNRKICKNFFLKNYKNVDQPQKLGILPQKTPYFKNIFKHFSFLNQTLGIRKSSLNQTTYLCTKILVVATIFLISRFFLKSQFLKSRFICTLCFSSEPILVTS